MARPTRLPACISRHRRSGNAAPRSPYGLTRQAAVTSAASSACRPMPTARSPAPPSWRPAALPFLPPPSAVEGTLPFFGEYPRPPIRAALQPDLPRTRSATPPATNSQAITGPSAKRVCVLVQITCASGSAQTARGAAPRRCRSSTVTKRATIRNDTSSGRTMNRPEADQIARIRMSAPAGAPAARRDGAITIHPAAARIAVCARISSAGPPRLQPRYESAKKSQRTSIHSCPRTL